MTHHLKINDNLFLTSQLFSPEEKIEKLIPLQAHHIFIIDCSGSMSGELPIIRKDLHNKISTILKPNDSVTIIWFSGKGEFGVVLEDYSVRSNIALERVRETINKYLTPHGLTAFKEPIEEAGRVMDRISKSKSDVIYSLFFLTDGHDNQCSQRDILKVSENLQQRLNGATIVEYGWYCNRELLTQMAQQMGGVHTFSQDFQDYEPYLSKQFSQEHRSARKLVKLSNKPILDIVFSVVDNDIVLLKPNENNEILTSSDSESRVFYLSSEAQDQCHICELTVSELFDGDPSHHLIQGLYATMFALSRKGDYNLLSEVLRFSGDAYLIKEKANTFGIQKITELEQKFIAAVNDLSGRYIMGYNPDLEPSEDAYCVLDLIDDLMDSEDNLWYPQHKAFSYKRIGSKSVSKTADLSDEDRKKIDDLLNKKKLDEAQKLLEQIKNNQPEELEFVYDGDMQAFPISDLVWNEKRANLSVQVSYKGHVVIPENTLGLPPTIQTYKVRNYTIIKDGIIHTYVLPVSLSRETFDKLQNNRLLQRESYEEGKVYELDFSTLPVINRKMAKTLLAKDLFTSEWELFKLKATNTAINQIKKKLSIGSTKKFEDLYGEEAAKWLNEHGVRDYGFAPPQTTEKSGEQINVNTLEVKIDKFNSGLTKKDFDSAEKKILSQEELSPREALLEITIKEFMQFEKLLTEVSSKNKMIDEWVREKSRAIKKRKNKLMSEISRAKFMTIIGKNWFNDFSDRSQNEMTLNLDSRDIKFKIEDKVETITI